MTIPVSWPSLASALFCLGILLWSPDCGAAQQPPAANRTSDQTYRDCSDLPADSPSGVYTLRPGTDDSEIEAYCDMDEHGGGWTVVLRRKNIEPRENFLRDWESYKWGIGELEKEFYWGNEYLWMLTSHLDRRYQVHFWLKDFDGNSRHALYQNFVVESGAAFYRLQVGEYSGDAGNSLSYHSNSSFSTFDNDHDAASGNCASDWGGGWWYMGGSSVCVYCKLTGVYYDGGHSGHFELGIVWNGWKDREPYSLKSVVMKIKPSLKS